MLTVEQGRQAVRLSTDRFDDEIKGLIEAAREDLRKVGIRRDIESALYDNALRMYIKGNFEPGAPDAEACREIYARIKEDMKLSDAYREDAEDE